MNILLLLLQLMCPTECYFRPVLLRKVEPLRWAFSGLWQLQISLTEQQELKLGTDIEVRDAGNGKGLGVFALRDVAKGTHNRLVPTRSP